MVATVTTCVLSIWSVPSATRELKVLFNFNLNSQHVACGYHLDIGRNLTTRESFKEDHS